MNTRKRLPGKMIQLVSAYQRGSYQTTTSITNAFLWVWWWWWCCYECHKFRRTVEELVALSWSSCWWSCSWIILLMIYVLIEIPEDLRSWWTWSMGIGGIYDGHQDLHWSITSIAYIFPYDFPEFIVFFLIFAFISRYWFDEFVSLFIS